MNKFRYIKADAFTSGASLGNPAACVFTGKEQLTAVQMLECAKEHKGFVMEMVFCQDSEEADCKLTYYSSECEVEFCGHGTIATMYTYISSDPYLMKKKIVEVNTNRKGRIQVFNEIENENAVYITAPDAVNYKVKPSIEDIARALVMDLNQLDTEHPVKLIDAGLRTLIIPVKELSDEISVYPDEAMLKDFTYDNDIDIILIYTMQTSDKKYYAHTRVFAPKFGYLEDPATGSGNSAFANYLLQEDMWDGSAISVEQGGNNRIFNEVRLKYSDGKVLFGGKATTKIEGHYFVR